MVRRLLKRFGPKVSVGVGVLGAVIPLAAGKVDSFAKVFPGHSQSLVFVCLVAVGVGWQLWVDRSDRNSEDSTKPDWSVEHRERARAALLAGVRRQWIDGVLDRSLESVARLELQLRPRSEAVDHPWGTLRAAADDAPVQLSEGTSLVDVFDRYEGRVLVLGQPGSGKTTTLLELTRDLLERAESDAAQPMPVVFHLSSWSGEQPALRSWLVDELVIRYGVARALAREWIAGDVVAPMLDGLDEVAESNRAGCVKAINDFRAAEGSGPLVVCSRSGDYAGLPGKLLLDCAVEIQPLDHADVDRYLRQAGRKLAGVRAVLDDDEQLREMVTSPLLLSVVMLAYQGVPATRIRASGTTADRRTALLDDYVAAMLARPRGALDANRPKYTPEETRRWLSRLAQLMNGASQSLFYPDWLQPDWLDGRALRVRAISGVLAVAGAVAAAGVVAIDVGVRLAGHRDPDTGWFYPVSEFVWVVVGFVSIAVLGFGRRVTPATRWSGDAMRSAVAGLLAGAIGGSVVGWMVLGQTHNFGVIPPRSIYEYGPHGDEFGIPVWSAVPLDLTIVLVAAAVSIAIYSVWVRARRQSHPHVSLRSAAAERFSTVALSGGAVASALSGGPLLVLSPAIYGGWYWGAIGYAVILGGPVILAFAAATQLRPVPEVAPQSPGAAIRRTGSQAAATGVAIFVIAFTIYAAVLVYQHRELSIGDFSANVIQIIFLGALAASMRLGLGDYLRHRAVGRLLSRHGALPMDLTTFLDHADSHILLRRTGGGYIFVHRIVLEYFAARLEVGDQSAG